MKTSSLTTHAPRLAALLVLLMLPMAA